MHYQLECFLLFMEKCRRGAGGPAGSRLTLLCVSGGASESQHMSIWRQGEMDRAALCSRAKRDALTMEVILRARWRCSNLVLSQMDRAGMPSQATQCFLSLPRTMNRQLEKIMDFCNSVSHYKVGKKNHKWHLFNIAIFFQDRNRIKWRLNGDPEVFSDYKRPQ